MVIPNIKQNVFPERNVSLTFHGENLNAINVKVNAYNIKTPK